MNFKVLVFFIFIIYAFSITSSPILGDSLAFSVLQSQGFELDTNATNHFLYVNFLSVLHKIFPFINPHYLFVFISILFSIFTLFFLRKFLRLFDISDKSILVTVLLLALSFSFWRISIITEVYAFYLFFVLLFFYHSFSFIKFSERKNFIYASILLGICFLIHIQSILFLPFYLLMIVRKNRVGVRSLALGVFTFLIIVFLLFIPVLLGKHNAMAILNDDKYHDSIFDYNIQTLVKSSIRNIGFLVYNFALFLILIPIGFRRTGYKVYFVVLLIPFLFFILKHNVSDSYVFHLVPYLIFTIWFGRALDCISFKIKPVYIFLLPVFYFATYNIVNFTSIGENINKETGFKGGTRYLFFPMLNGNPKIQSFIEEYENKRLKDLESFQRQYEFAKEWVEIERNY